MVNGHKISAPVSNIAAIPVSIYGWGTSVSNSGGVVTNTVDFKQSCEHRHYLKPLNNAVSNSSTLLEIRVLQGFFTL
jgi:hypothetical protein